MAYYIDTFFESANYDEVINSILDDVFKYLKNDLQISYKYDYYENRYKEIVEGNKSIQEENEGL